jgi:hypothetical protein
MRITANGYSEIVTAMLSFDANHAIDPPNCGMVEQQGFDSNLEQIYQRIKALDVGQFMGDDGFQLLDRQACHRRNREQDYRTEPSQDSRCSDDFGIGEANQTIDTDALLQPAAAFKDGWTN